MDSTFEDSDYEVITEKYRQLRKKQEREWKQLFGQLCACLYADTP